MYLIQALPMRCIDRRMTPSLRLNDPIALTGGGSISTVNDALNFYFSLPMHERIEWHWTEAAKLLVATFEENGGAFLERAQRQFRIALTRYLARCLKTAA
jgi:hypothetical protein